MSSRRQRIQVFSITWIAYASYYLCRKNFSVTKSRIAEQFHLSLSALGHIDTGFLVAYAAGQFASGIVCDAVGPRRLIGFGMIASAIAALGFGASSTAAQFAFAFIINGFAQSTGWPGTVKAMTPWFSTEERGRVMGVWSTCYQVGGIAATALATWLLTNFGWRSSFFVPALWLALVGGVVLLYLPTQVTVKEQRRQTTLRVLKNPLLWNLGAAYFGLKLIRYSLLFWLPFYLHRELGYSESQSGYLSLAFEIGGVAGAVSAGALSDKLNGRRGPVLVVMSIGLALAVMLYSRVASVSMAANFFAMMGVGFMLFGPDALVSATAAQDLGGAEGAGTAAGIINGVGSLGGIAQGTVTAWVVEHYGWGALFRTFWILALLCALILLPFALRKNSPPANA